MDRRTPSPKVDEPSILIRTAEGERALIFDKVARGVLVNLAAAALFGFSDIQRKDCLAATGVEVDFKPTRVVDAEPSDVRIVLHDTEAT